MRRFMVLCVPLLIAVAIACAPSHAAVRKVVLELFTSTTCPPCYNADVYLFQTWLPGYADKARVIPIAYHTWWPSPGNDPMYLANPSPVQTRTPFYQGTTMYVPRLYVDGSTDGTSAYGTWASLIASRLQVTSPIAITLVGSVKAGVATVRARITAEQAVTSTNWRLMWVVVEDSIAVPQTNGTTYVPFVHESVHRTMLPSVNGTVLSITQGQTVDVTQTVTLDQTWKTGKVKVVVFVQDISTREILNAEEIGVGQLTDVEMPKVTAPGRFVLEQNYPNPFNPSTAFTFAVSRSGYATLIVYNSLGQEVGIAFAGHVETGQYHTVQFDAHGLSSGVYYVRLQSGSDSQMRKIVLMR